MEIPETRYATTADHVSIAYQDMGSGPPDVVLSNPHTRRTSSSRGSGPPPPTSYRGLAARGRLLLFDRRGSGLSDSVSADRLPTLEARMDDIRAVMDAAGSDRAILVGLEDGAALCFLFAATYPDRVAALITFDAASRGSWAPDAPWLDTEERWDEYFEGVEAGWGTREFNQALADEIFPSHSDDPCLRRGLLAARPPLDHQGRCLGQRSDVEGHRRASYPSDDPGPHARHAQPRHPRRTGCRRGEPLHREPHPRRCVRTD